MANLNTITKLINQNLIATSLKDKRFQKVAAYGISKSLPYKKGDVLEYIPTELCDNGDGKELSPDDKNPIQVYHKMYGTRYSIMKEQYGNGNTSLIRTADMSLIVFAQRNIVKLSEEQMELFVLTGIPNKLTKANLTELNLKDCTINVSSTDFDSVKIFNREYNTKKYYLKPSHIFFEMRYIIECKFDKNCINTCPTC